MSLIKLLAVSYLLTILMEVPCGFFWGVRRPEDYVILICVNTITNPAVVLLSWYFRIHMVIWDAKLCLLFIEVAVVIIEGLLFRKTAKCIEHPFAYSIQANALSFAGGIFLSMYVF